MDPQQSKGVSTLAKAIVVLLVAAGLVLPFFLAWWLPEGFDASRALRNMGFR